MENATCMPSKEAVNKAREYFETYQKQGCTEIVVQLECGTRFDFSYKPQWINHLEQRGINVDPMVWAK